MNQKIGKIPVVFSRIFNILYTEECTHKEAEQVLGVVRSMVNESRKFAEYDTIDNYLVRKKQRNAILEKFLLMRILYLMMNPNLSSHHLALQSLHS